MIADQSVSCWLGNHIQTSLLAIHTASIGENMTSHDDDQELPEDSSGDALSTEERLALVRAVDVLFQKWELTDFERRVLLGVEHDEHLEVWHADNVAALSQDIVVRLTDFIRIHGALRVIFRNPDQCYSWVKRPNDTFSGKSALEVMVQDGTPGIVRVRSYLEAEVEG